MAAAVVTGATKGIGAAIAVALARAGCDIVGVARSEPGLAAMRERVEAHDVRWVPLAADLSDPLVVQQAAARILATERDLAILVNNAGAGVGYRAFSDISLEDFRRIMRVNVVAPYLLIRALAPSLAASGRGRIVNISSAAASNRVPPHTTSAAYAGAKGGLGALTRQAARVLAPQGIAVNAVLPGDVMTEAGRAWFEGLTDAERQTVLARIPRGELTTPEEVAHMVVALCHPDAAGTVGASVEVNSGAWIR